MATAYQVRLGPDCDTNLFCCEVFSDRRQHDHTHWSLEAAVSGEGPPLWSDFLAANPEVPGSIPGAKRFSE
jgi:hypothetical protein